MKVLSLIEKKVDKITMFTILLIPVISVIVNFILNSFVDLFTALSQFWIALLLMFQIYKREKDLKKLLQPKYISFGILVLLMIIRSISILSYDKVTKWNALSIFVYGLIILNYSVKEERKKLYNFIVSNELLINIEIGIYILVIIITIINGVGMQFIWGSFTLKGPFSFQHYLAYDMLTFICIAELLRLYTKKQWYLGYTIICTAVVLTSGVRTIMFALVFLGLVEINLIKNKRIKLGIIISVPAAIIITFISGLYKIIPVLAKFQNTLNGGSISNGRNIFWKQDITSFFDLGVLNKLFGVGDQWLKDLNLRVVNQAIHAHNDFINIMIMFGIIALILYSALTILCINYKNKILFYCAIILCLAFMNALYTYSVFVISMPIVTLFFDCLGDSINMEERYE